jgi:hypothetical protein
LDRPARDYEAGFETGDKFILLSKMREIAGDSMALASIPGAFV